MNRSIPTGWEDADAGAGPALCELELGPAVRTWAQGEIG